MSEWISVKDRLPNEGDSVLITDKINMYIRVNGCTKNDWTYSYCCGCKADGITHWMTLPSLPGESK